MTLISQDSFGAQGSGPSGAPTVSRDGRYVAFHSKSPNLITGDSNGHQDIFLRDRVAGTTTRVSVSSDGSQANGASANPSISDDGRYIAFQSDAANLVGSDSNTTADIFVHDRIAGITTRVSVSGSAEQANAGSGVPVISGDGRYVAFESTATNLGSGDNNSVGDVFLRDRTANTTEIVSVSGSGALGNAASFAADLSGNGRYISFTSIATNLVANDSNGNYDIFVRDRTSGITARSSLDESSNQLLGDSFTSSISDDGATVAFRASSIAGGVFSLGIRVWDRATNSSTLISVASDGGEASGFSLGPSVSGDGRYVSFHSFASNLVGNDQNGKLDVFMRDLDSGLTSLASADPDGVSGGERSLNSSMSADGSAIVFESDASDLVLGDSNSAADIFLREGLGGESVDAAPPEVTSLNASPLVVDILDVGRQVNVNVRVVDATGTTTPKLRLLHAGSGEASTSVDATLVSGTPTDGIWEAILVLPVDPILGTWDLLVLPLVDTIGNVGVLGPPIELAIGVLVIDSSLDSEAPVLTGFGFTPGAIAEGISTDITVSISVLDGSGIDAPWVWFEHVTTGALTSAAQAVLVSGSAADGTWEATTTMAADADGGFWRARLQPLVDIAGNESSPGPTSGFPSQIYVGAVPSAPVNLSITPGSRSLLASWSPPLTSNGSLLTNYVVRAEPGSVELTVSSTQLSVVISGLTDGQSYVVYVAAINEVGEGPAVYSLDVKPSSVPASDGDGNTPDSGTPDSGTPDSGTPDSGTPDVPGGNPGLTESGYWMLGDNGRVHRFGEAGYYGGAFNLIGTAPGVSAVDIEKTPTGNGYWILDDTGRVHPFGDAKHLGDVPSAALLPGEMSAAISGTSSGNGYWLFTTRGRVIEYGDAEYFGDMMSVVLNGEVIDSIATASGEGYYMVGSDGGIFAFGDAEFFGSMGGIQLNEAVVGLAPTPDGNGYWLVASDGGIFAFGSAPFSGSMGGTSLNAPVNGMVAFGDGYLMVAGDGGIFNFSTKPFDGSLGGSTLDYAIVGVAPLN